jgi:hypothetical protein
MYSCKTSGKTTHKRSKHRWKQNNFELRRSGDKPGDLCTPNSFARDVKYRSLQSFEHLVRWVDHGTQKFSESNSLETFTLKTEKKWENKSMMVLRQWVEKMGDKKWLCFMSCRGLSYYQYPILDKKTNIKISNISVPLAK